MIEALDLVGKTVSLSGYRGDGEKRVGKVIAVRDTHAALLNPSTLRNTITRGRWLFTIEDSERNVTRSYYISHVSQVKVMGPLRKVVRKAAVATGVQKVKVN